MKTIKDFFVENGILAENLDFFEYRDSQYDMALAINDAIEQQKHIIIEAGTGTGKSYAYLIPLILYTIENDAKIIISTKTKSLQQQMIKKDLPVLNEIMKKMDLNFIFRNFYGSNNYICLTKTETLLFANYLDFYIAKEEKEFIAKYANDLNNSGIRFDVLENINNQTWKMMNRDPDLCLKKQCKYYEKCFYFKNLKELYTAHVIVINHHLFFANVKSEYNILPKTDIFVWDEAHSVEDVASKFLANIISEFDINFLFNRIQVLFRHPELSTITEKQSILDHNHKIRQMQESFKDFFKFIKDNYAHNTRIKSQIFPKDILISFEEFINEINSVFNYVLNISEELDLEINLIKKRLDQIKYDLTFFLEHDNEEFVYWIEIFGKKKLCELKFTPINISNYLSSKVFNMYKTGILTSATLSTNNNFNFIKSRLGLIDCVEKIYASPFNFKKQVQLYFNQNIALPTDYEQYVNDISKVILKLIQISQGKAFILFTNYQTLNQVKENIIDEIEYKLFIQNEKPAYKLLEEFKQDTHSVLMATLSFWEGVDVPGEALSLVIITRLPFDVPDDPLIAARIDYIKKKEGNAFMEYQLPNAIILLKQGFGRLIRNSRDKGIVAILDSRIVKKSYGKQFLNSLPECELMLEDDYSS